MNRYWNLGGMLLKRDSVNDFTSQGAVEITKVEYDKGVTLPAMSANNINHNYFNGAEMAIKREMLAYENSLFTMHKIDGYGNALILSDDNLVLYNNFKQFEKATTKVAITRAITMYDSMLNGDTAQEAQVKAEAVKIDLSSSIAMNGKNEFFGWLIGQHPTLIRTYITYVQSLGYTTVLTEDEPEGSK